MTIPFNADEILEMAVTIEKNGAAFYRRAAEKAQDPEARTFFNGLVAMEEEHGTRFREFRDRWKVADNRQALFDPDMDASKILKAWADGFIFDIRDESVSPVDGSESIEEILRTAVKAEKDSTVFYLGLREAVKNAEDRAMIDKIIGEEMAHLAELNLLFAKTKSG
ncbi:MAG: ferritin-like domain-containing protein [Planctomycetota bacterium]|jgi:rubrerythrin